MNQHLVWNFEFSPKTNIPLATYMDEKDEQLKWEVRYFGSAHETIILNPIDRAFLELTNYKHKDKEDYYYLLPDLNYNIKRRHNQLLYKPLLKRAKHAVGYGKKIILDPAENTPSQDPQMSPDLQNIIKHIEKESVGINVQKEALIYKIPTKPTIKIELARLEVLHKIYFSVCIEGRSLNLVETISQHLLGKHISCEYVTFLKNILKL